MQPQGGADPDHAAVDETVIQVNDNRFWLYAVVDPEINLLLYFKLSPMRKPAVSSIFSPNSARNIGNIMRCCSSLARFDSTLPVTVTSSNSNTSHMGIEIASNVYSVR